MSQADASEEGSLAQEREDHYQEEEDNPEGGEGQEEGDSTDDSDSEESGNAEAKSDQVKGKFCCTLPGCTKVYGWSHHLRRHVKTHTMPAPYVCAVEGCGRSYFKKFELRHHHAIAHEGRPLFSCDICKKNFNSNAQLARHKQSHEARPCPKEGCSEVFDTYKELRRHLGHHRQEEAQHLKPPKALISVAERKTFVCNHPGCNKSYTEKRNLNQHKKASHTNSRPFVCSAESCGKAFKYKCVLERHMVSLHEGQENDDEGGEASGKKRRKKMTAQELAAETVGKLQKGAGASNEYQELLLDTLIGIGT